MDVRTVEEEFAFSIRVCISYALEVQVELAVFYSLKHQVFNEIVKKIYIYDSFLFFSDRLYYACGKFRCAKCDISRISLYSSCKAACNSALFSRA